jgi:hypothetical protein
VAPLSLGRGRSDTTSQFSDFAFKVRVAMSLRVARSV